MVYSVGNVGFWVELAGEKDILCAGWGRGKALTFGGKKYILTMDKSGSLSKIRKSLDGERGFMKNAPQKLPKFCVLSDIVSLSLFSFGTGKS